MLPSVRRAYHRSSTTILFAVSSSSFSIHVVHSSGLRRNTTVASTPSSSSVPLPSSTPITGSRRKLPKDGITLKESLEIIQTRENRKRQQREKTLVTQSASIPDFDTLLDMRKIPSLTRNEGTILQINIGKLCDRVCHHCHVEAGPTRTQENMDKTIIDRILQLIKESNQSSSNPNERITVVDITGGAPELNPHFRYLVESIHRISTETAGISTNNNSHHPPSSSPIQILNRCNLSVLFTPGQENTVEFFARHKVNIIASLPGLDNLKVDKQRGKGAWDYSVQGLLLLNKYGYGSTTQDSSLQLDLIYNPDGASLPGSQEALESEFKRQLRENYGIVFNRLLTITNMPIKRFADDLVKKKEYTNYMSLLAMNFNPLTLPYLMCRNTVSVSWDGKLSDCDFNQQLDKYMLMHDPTLQKLRPLTVYDIKNVWELNNRPITTHKGCYGCTAGAGSSCGGKLL